MKFLCLLFNICFVFQATAQQQTVIATRPVDFVDIKNIDPTIQVDMMYFTNTNFIGRPIAGYKKNTCYLSQPAAQALKKAQERLQVITKKSPNKLSLWVRDCYRPHKAVQEFVKWVADPEQQKMKSIFYPEVDKAELIKQKYISPTSGHSRGSTVDLTIALIDGNGNKTELPMGTPVDFFSEKSNTDNAEITKEERDNRQLLKTVMTPEFKNYSKEWWHYSYKPEPHPLEFFDFDIE